MPEHTATRVNLVTLNTQGIPKRGSRLRERYAAIGAAVDAGDAEVACFQEVFTWWHLRLLAKWMSSYPHVSWRPSLAGPAGGLVTFSRLPLTSTVYRGFGSPPKTPGIARVTRQRASRKGALMTMLARPGLSVINTHPAANTDGDWSPANRYYPLHQAQLGALARVVRGAAGPAVVCGDFNVDRDSELFGEFMTGTGLADAFDGRCPATFQAEFLPAGKSPHCIDFILTGGGVKAETATVEFAGREALPGGPGYISDHIGLRASLLVAPP